MDYNTISKKNNLFVLSSLVFHGLMFKFSDFYRENVFLSVIFLVILPGVCLIYLLFKYFQLHQNDRFEFFRILLFMVTVVLLAKENLL